MEKQSIQLILLKIIQNFVWACIIMEHLLFLVNGTGIYKFKAKYSEIVATPLCLGNISKDWKVDNMKKTE